MRMDGRSFARVLMLMKRALPIVISVLFATPMFATWWPSFSPDRVKVKVGETVYVTEQARWSGLVDYGNGINWRFGVADEDIASGYAEVSNSQPVPIAITGLAPGITNLAQLDSRGRPGYGYVTILVTCGEEPPVQPAQSATSIVLGDAITLRATTPISDRSTFVWYAGQIGDTTRPVNVAGPELTFTPESAGVHNYWVMAITPCSTSSAAFHIEVVRPKRRAVR